MMLVVMVLVLAHPTWWKPFNTIFTAFFVVIVILSLAAIWRKP